MNDLNTLPDGMDIPNRPPKRGGRGTGSVIRISKSDFEYMSERGFRGRFAIPNKRINGHIDSERIAAALGHDKTIVLSIANKSRTTTSPDGATWRTVRLVSAFRTEDGKLCVIEIESPNTKGGAR